MTVGPMASTESKEEHIYYCSSLLSVLAVFITALLYSLYWPWDPLSKTLTFEYSFRSDEALWRNVWRNVIFSIKNFENQNLDFRILRNARQEVEHFNITAMTSAH